MRIPFFKGLRYEILGNLTVVLLFALLLTGLGVWFINGKEMIQENMLRGQALLQSLQEEIVSNGTIAGPESSLSNKQNLIRVKKVMDRYHQRNPRFQLLLVDGYYRVKAFEGVHPQSSIIQDAVLSMALAQKRICSELKGKQGLFGLPERIEIAAPLIKGDKIIGGLLGYFSLKDILSSAKRTQKFIFIYMGLGTLVVLVFGTILLSHTIVHPLERMNDIIDRMGGGDINQLVPVSSKNEIGRLAEAFNTMAESLKQHQRVLQDHVKALRRVNQELKQSQEEVIRSEKLASVGLLAAGVAHEIGNPLSSILGYVGILQQGVDAQEEQNNFLSRIEKEILRIHTILKELREYSKPSLLEKRPCDVNVIIQNTIQMISTQGDFRMVLFETDLEPELPKQRLDENQFQQVLVNLFLNAKDAMHKNWVVRVISRRSVYQAPQEALQKEEPRRRDDPPGIDFHLLRRSNPPRRERFVNGQPLVEIDVVDNGKGISKEHLNKVFDPFFTTKDTGRGTGLGLAICQRIIESFHGDIKIESEPGKGCKVMIFLPVEETKGSEEER